jgi:hypothetical protein
MTEYSTRCSLKAEDFPTIVESYLTTFRRVDKMGHVPYWNRGHVYQTPRKVNPIPTFGTWFYLVRILCLLVVGGIAILNPSGD